MRLKSENQWKLLVRTSGKVSRDPSIVEREEEVIFAMASCKADQKDVSTPVILWLTVSPRRQDSAAKNGGVFRLKAESE
ncbi:hypothetical protein TcBrA4_0069710 [Trypanosoma cruzi]|nr:hypothetical protein TcBrA4_0069710 [Trypanosoma cruzi]